MQNTPSGSLPSGWDERKAENVHWACTAWQGWDGASREVTHMLAGQSRPGVPNSTDSWDPASANSLCIELQCIEKALRQQDEGTDH